jgi:hypothetical protein
LGERAEIKITAEAQQNNVTAADITITYDPNRVEGEFEPDARFTTIINDAKTPGKVRYVGVNPTATAITGTFNIGTFKLTGKQAGTAVLKFENIHINASGVESALRIKDYPEGSYTIN